MTGVRSAMVALALTGAASSVAAQAEFRSGVSRQAADRRAEGRQTDSAQRHNDSQRQTEVPKPVTLRQPEPQRQPEPARKAEPRRQPEPQRQSGTSSHWQDPAPAWQSPGPAWRDLNGRSGSTHRPGQDAFRAAPDTYTSRDRSHRRDGRHDDGPRRGGKRSDNIVYGYPYVGPFGYATYPVSYEETIVGSAVTTSAPDVDDEPHGFLRLRILPRTADVHIDGAWAGTVDDFGGSGERMLPADRTGSKSWRPASSRSPSTCACPRTTPSPSRASSTRSIASRLGPPRRRRFRTRRSTSCRAATSAIVRRS